MHELNALRTSAEERRPLATTIALVVLLLVLPSAALSQSRLTATVVDSASGTPLRGVVVSAHPAATPTARVIAERLTDPDGRLTYAALPTGRYVLRVRRVGYQPYQSPVLAIAPGGAPVEVVLRVPARRIVLPAVTVVADRRCPGGFGRAESALGLWTEVQTTLASAALAQEDSAHRVPVLRTERYLARDGRPLYAEPPVPAEAQPAFQGLAPAELSADGYVSPGESSQSWVFHAPSVEVLRSQEFERDHCFRVVSPPGAADSLRGLLGLAFEPHRARRVSEIAGVLWIDTTTAALRRVTFRFVNSAALGGGRRADGDLRIDVLPTGAWGVVAWELRVPRQVGSIEEQSAPRFMRGVRPIPADSATDMAVGAVIAAREAAAGARAPRARHGIDAVVLPTGMDCGRLGPAACLRHANDYALGTGLARDPGRANAYHLGACRSGSRPRLRLASRGQRDDSPLDTVAIDSIGRALDLFIRRRNQSRASGLREDDLTPEFRAEYERRAQLDACARLALSLLTDASASAAHAHAAILLEAACDELEPVACTMRGLLVAASATSARDSATAAQLFARGCTGRHAEGCRALFRLRPELAPDTIRLDGRRGQGGGSAASLLDSWVHARLGADARGLGVTGASYAEDARRLQAWLPFADVEAFPKGVLVRLWANRPVRGFATPTDPLDPTTFAQVIAALHELPERRVTLVMHQDSLATGTDPRMLQQTDRHLMSQALRWLDHWRRAGIERGRIRIEIRGYRDPIAWNGTQLGREQNRRVEIIVQ